MKDASGVLQTQAAPLLLPGVLQVTTSPSTQVSLQCQPGRVQLAPAQPLCSSYQCHRGHVPQPLATRLPKLAYTFSQAQPRHQPMGDVMYGQERQVLGPHSSRGCSLPPVLLFHQQAPDGHRA